MCEPRMCNQLPLLPSEPINTFIFSSIECQTCNKHQGDSEAHPRPWEVSSLAPPVPCVAGKLKGGGLGLPRGSSASSDARKRAPESRTERKAALTLAACGAQAWGFSVSLLSGTSSTSASGTAAFSQSCPRPGADTPTLSSPRRSLPRAALGPQRAVQGQGGNDQLLPVLGKGGGY